LSWQLTGLRLHQQLIGLSLPSQLLARAVTGHAAADAELHQSGVKAAPAQAAANVSQKQQPSKKKGKNGLTLQDQSALTLLDLKHVIGLALKPAAAGWLQSQTQHTFQVMTHLLHFLQ